MTKFKKGDKVVIIHSWDDRGTMAIRRGQIHSAGKTRIHIQYTSGDMAKERWYTNGETSLYQDADNASIEALALEKASEFLAGKRERMKWSMERSEHKGYLDAMEAELDKLHEPNFIWK